MPIKTTDKNIKERFWAKVKRTYKCWEWTGSKDKDGYGVIRFLGKLVKAHRKSWEFSFGFISKEMCVMHKCDNPGCVNPDHLFLGTNKDNQRDKYIKGRTAKGIKNGRSILTPEKVKVIRNKYNTGHYSQQKLANEFKMSQQQISNIVNNKHWT